ncbi:MAG: hypothetical protein Q7K03_01665 [Dehalococcoidia bacterium]|nr:hypothetical protein [Dehalococcoidia bacterium]
MLQIDDAIVWNIVFVLFGVGATIVAGAMPMNPRSTTQRVIQIGAVLVALLCWLSALGLVFHRAIPIWFWLLVWLAIAVTILSFASRSTTSEWLRDQLRSAGLAAPLAALAYVAAIAHFGTHSKVEFPLFFDVPLAVAAVFVVVLWYQAGRPKR